MSYALPGRGERTKILGPDRDAGAGAGGGATAAGGAGGGKNAGGGGRSSTGSIIIFYLSSKVNFMSRASSEGAGGSRKGSKERVCAGTKTKAEVRPTDSQWFIGVGENLVVRK